MIIRKTASLLPGNNRVLLLRKNAALEPLIADQDQRAYLEKRFSQEKDHAHFNLLSHQFFVQQLKDEDRPMHLRLEDARKAAHQLGKQVRELDLASLVIDNGGVSPEESLAFAEGLALASYQFDRYIREENRKAVALKEILVADEGLSDKEVTRMENVVRAVYQTRDLVNEPLSHLNAEKLALRFEEMGREAGFDVEVFSKLKIESLKMGGLLAVNKGSVDPPTFSILTYQPEEAINSRPIVLVGKGVVFDTGGLSLKPTQDSMDYMKCDMGGAAAVAGAIYAASLNELPLWIIALVPATDNRPDGNAYVPGDVITMYDGSTVEVLNTDAEGRMILADALSYAKKYDPEVVIELSTLTGSAHAALDKYGIAGMGNADREVMENLKESGDYVSERIAEFPFWDEYREALKSDIADLKNIGGRYAGAITAGKFLEHFTDYPYIHLDIAGPSFNKIPFNYRGKGGSGVGVRILHQYLSNRTR